MNRYFKAIEKGNEEEVSRLLDADPTLVEKENSDGDRPLAIAAEAGQLGMVKLLVQRTADINASGRVGFRALHHAAREGLKEMVAFLLSKGAQARIRDRYAGTPLTRAFEMGHADVMKVLLQHMGLQGLKDRIEMKWTPLMEACGEGKVGLVREIVQHMGGQELEETDKRERTALHWAALSGHTEVLAILLGKGAQAGIGDANDSTPLMKAASRGHLAVVRLLVQHTGGQGLDETSIHGETALHWAVKRGHEAVMAFLLSQGAQATIADRCGITPFMSAAAGGHVGMAQLFLELQGGQGIDDRGHTGKTALHCAVQGGHAEAAAWLLRNGARSSIRDEDGRTPLMEVCELGRLGALQILLQEVGEQGLREQDVAGHTALHWAALMDYEEAVQALLLAGADPTITTNGGGTPRALAEEYGHDECADVFEWWDGELERRYILQRAWCIHDAYMTHQEKPTASLPAFLQDRVAAGQALPKVEMAGGHQEEQPAATSGKRKASSDRQEGQAHQEEEEVNAVLAYVVTQLRDAPLFREFMHCFHAPRCDDAAVGEEDVNDDYGGGDEDEEDDVEGDDVEGDDDEEEDEEESEEDEEEDEEEEEEE